MTHSHEEHTAHEHDENCAHEGACGDNCQCEGGCQGNCGCGESSCGDGCGCEQEADGVGYLLHKAKMKVLLEKLSAHISKEHGAEYEKLAKLLLEVAHDDEKNKEAKQKKRDLLNEQFSKLFD